jgi:hypothetical protein
MALAVSIRRAGGDRREKSSFAFRVGVHAVAIERT